MLCIKVAIPFIHPDSTFERGNPNLIHVPAEVHQRTNSAADLICPPYIRGMQLLWPSDNANCPNIVASHPMQTLDYCAHFIRTLFMIPIRTRMKRVKYFIRRQTSCMGIFHCNLHVTTCTRCIIGSLHMDAIDVTASEYRGMFYGSVLTHPTVEACILTYVPHILGDRLVPDHFFTRDALDGRFYSTTGEITLVPGMNHLGEPGRHSLIPYKSCLRLINVTRYLIYPQQHDGNVPSA
ncbi:hypothetical protein BU24DRAFT_179170 [Aaosphaeria arxii CBS 175.79]|uniref:Uncharacterized protein n=1 Tax=Aaosphaeria arxii CBS 175.79 TaxID=1450172 RepID=A0A6A5XRU7_9PLEO|nr:uncharacterized protein BU24DRAFT_179170 [Aaosphaeria arxii CBS 175.79]KAF2015471.1 hypothetical protein BU24DRAFT_179170 [Aaosphaeria arxii CBS 175.79]